MAINANVRGVQSDDLSPHSILSAEVRQYAVLEGGDQAGIDGGDCRYGSIECNRCRAHVRCDTVSW